jgi:hypothetical protein
MSLSQRLTAVEEIEPWSREASPDSRQRKMSFNPVGTWTEATGEEPTVGAFEVPKWKRMGMCSPSCSEEYMLITSSPGPTRRHILPLRRGRRLRIRRDKTGPYIRGCI